MEFTVEDFDSMKFSPLYLRREELMEDKYPEMKKILTPEMRIEGQMYDFNRMLKSICYLFDKGTPLVRISHFSTRRMEAMKLAGYPIIETEEGWEVKGNERLTKALRGKDAFYNRVSILFLRLFRSTSYSLLVGLDTAYYRAMEKLISGDGKDKENIQIIDDLKNRIEKEWEDFFQARPNEELRQEINMVITEDQLRISPEDIARRLADGDYISFA